MVQLQTAGLNAQSLTVARSFDTNGRLVQQKSDQRLDLGLEYEKDSGRVTRVTDALREMRLGYTNEAEKAPWPKTVSEGGAVTLGATDRAKQAQLPVVLDR